MNCRSSHPVGQRQRGEQAVAAETDVGDPPAAVGLDQQQMMKPGEYRTGIHPSHEIDNAETERPQQQAEQCVELIAVAAPPVDNDFAEQVAGGEAKPAARTWCLRFSKGTVMGLPDMGAAAAYRRRERPGR